MTARTALVTAGTAALVLIAVGPAPAQAGSPAPPRGGTVSGPQPVDEPPLLSPAGSTCAFDLQLTPTRNEVQVVRYTDRTGRVAAELYDGALVSTATNLQTGASESLDLSATALFTYAPDGTTDIYARGPYGIGLHPGDSPGPFYAVPDGRSHVRIDPDGHKTVLRATSLRNVCTDLGQRTTA